MKEYVSKILIKISRWINKKVNYFIVAHFLINKENFDESDEIIQRAISENRLQELEDKVESLTSQVDKIQLKKDRQKRLDYIHGKIHLINETLEYLRATKEPLVIERDILAKKIKNHYQGG
jgi:peptidoglycan hydrolase CwlO-like protein